jgi:hypothetical protein
MCILTAFRRLVSAATVYGGPHGAVQQLADQRETSRQSVYREAKQTLTDIDGSATQAQLEDLRRQVAQRDARLAELEAQLAQAVAVDPDRLAEFAATAQAIGVSLPQTQQLLRSLLRERTPSVAALGRLTARAAQQAQALLPILDAAARPQVRDGAGDEIYSGRQAIQMLVEPASLYWGTGQLCPQLTGAAWTAVLTDYPKLEYFVSDAGTALARGMRDFRAARTQAGLPDCRHGLDIFHTKREGNRACQRDWRRAGAALEEAGRRQQRQQKNGQSRHGYLRAQRQGWQQANARWDHALAQEQAWQQAQQALELFRPDGSLADRAWAEATAAAGLAGLQGAHWDKTKRLLGPKRGRGPGRKPRRVRVTVYRGRLRRRTPEAKRPRLQRPGSGGADRFAFLDRWHEQLQNLGLPPETLRAHLDLEGLRRRPELLRAATPEGAAARGRVLVRTVQLQQSEPEREAQAVAVRAVVNGVVRASSAVEGINSVLRMGQARHRKLTQGLLDLKRFYWNCHRFRTGRRKGKTPLELLGVRLPVSDWWQLLKMTPDQLSQHLSAQAHAL